MSRFPKDDLEALKATVDVAVVIGAVVSLEPQGSDLVGRCPFHDEATASFKVTPHKRLWHCFGCGAGGDVIEFVVKHQRVSFRHAVELLKARAPLSASPKTARKLPSPVALGADHADVLDDVAGFYHSTLNDSPEALAYFEKRGISSTAIAHFRLGYANRTLGLRLPAKNRVDGEKLRGLLTDLGIYRESGHEHLAGSVVVPLLDDAGRVVGMYGRKLLTNLRPGTAKHLYLPGPHRGVFNGAALSMSTEVILCESLIDALTFWSAGLHNVTTSYGVEGFTGELLSTLKASGVRTVLIAYDRDDAGDAAAASLTTKLEAEGFVVGRVLFPKGLDANEYALKVKPAAKSLALVVERARELLLGKKATVEKTVANVTPTMTTEPARKPTPTPLAASPSSTTSIELVPSIEALPPLTSPPSPASPTSSMVVEVTDDEIVMVIGDRRYRVRGFARNTSKDLLKVNLMVSRGDDFHVDSFDFYAQRFRNLFVKLAAFELHVDEEVIKKDLGRVLLKLEELQDDEVRKMLTEGPATPTMTPEEEQAALSLLCDPNLLDRVLEDFTRCGVVGEETNKLMGYLGMTSRKLDKPLAIVIQSSSAAGKSSLMDAILAFCPEEERLKYSAMTGQALFYMSGKDLKHKVLAVVEEEGAQKASYSLKLLQSEGELIIASTGKDGESGRQMTAEYRIEGPVMLFLTTTAIEIDEELMNRCLVLTVDEEREQTRAIHKLQRERRTLQGRLLGRDRAGILKLHENAQRLLRPLAVVNPWADQLTFVDDRTRTRRDHMKYLTLIDTIALVHQMQREVKTAEHVDGVLEFIEVTLDDIAMANRLAHVVLGRSLDELPPQTRKLLDMLDVYVGQLCNERAMDRSSVRLTRREMLDVTGMGYSQLTIHLDRLVALEHVLVHAGTRGRSFVYELLFDGHGGKGGAPHLSGLIDVERLNPMPTTSSSRGVLGSISGSSRAILGGTPENAFVDDNEAENGGVLGEIEKRTSGASTKTAAYQQTASHTQLDIEDET